MATSAAPEWAVHVQEHATWQAELTQLRADIQTHTLTPAEMGRVYKLGPTSEHSRTKAKSVTADGW